MGHPIPGWIYGHSRTKLTGSGSRESARRPSGMHGGGKEQGTPPKIGCECVSHSLCMALGKQGKGTRRWAGPGVQRVIRSHLGRIVCGLSALCRAQVALQRSLRLTGYFLHQTQSRAQGLCLASSRTHGSALGEWGRARHSFVLRSLCLG